LPDFLRELPFAIDCERKLQFHAHTESGNCTSVTGTVDATGDAGHLDQADGTLRALDSIVTRCLSTKQQREISLHELIDRIQIDHNEHNLTTWIVSTTVIILILGIVFLTSKYWRRPFLRFASQMFGRRPLEPKSPPRPKRQLRAPKLPVINEEGTSTAWEQGERSLLERSEDSINPLQDA
jgi:hypothetical protein